MAWNNESARHSLARKGIKTGLAYAPIAKGQKLAIGASFAVAENTINVLEPSSILGGVKGGAMAQYLKADMDEYSHGEKIGRTLTKRKETKEQKKARKIKEKLAKLMSYSHRCNGVGISIIDNKPCIVINLESEIEETLPDDIDGVPIVTKVVGKIHAQNS